MIDAGDLGDVLDVVYHVADGDLRVRVRFDHPFQLCFHRGVVPEAVLKVSLNGEHAGCLLGSRSTHERRIEVHHDDTVVGPHQFEHVVRHVSGMWR